MPLNGPSELLHLVGFLTGTLLYGMLLVLVIRASASPDGFALATALLGVAWNVGELGSILLQKAELPAVARWLSVGAFSALGFLGAVVVHSAARASFTGGTRRVGRSVAVMLYAGAVIAAALHVTAAADQRPLPSSPGLLALSVSMAVALVALVLAGAEETNHRRTLWLGSLAIFAVSALHLGRFHGNQEAWLVEIVGHHASLLLVFALLYQDYRFAFADLFLKNALTLLALVSLVFGAYAAVTPLLFTPAAQTSATSVGIVLAVWTTTVLLFPVVRHAVVRFVDAIVLDRPDYETLLDRHAGELQACEQVPEVLACTAAMVREALTASAVTWDEADDVGDADRDVLVDASEPPHYRLRVGRLAGGRRLLSGDRALLERAAMLAARRIDALRLDGERYERMLEEREMRSLAAEAELRALRAQINPHFLFNALTTIGYLIQHAPTRAVDALLRLTTLLRSVLRPEGELTTLGRECALIECYLEIEQERFESRLRFRVDVPTDLEELAIPGLIVQPLVENAIKHGIAKAADGGIVEVSVRRDTEVVVIVRNTGLRLGAASAREGFGVGLSGIAQRLRHHYGAAASVRLGTDTDGATVAELRLPFVAMTQGAGVPIRRGHP
jgi:hypothetical protein